MAAAAAAQQNAAAAASASKGAAAEDDDDEMPELEAAEETGPVDEGDLDPKEIEMVMEQVRIIFIFHCGSYVLTGCFQTGCTRVKAVAALKESGGDLINASMYSAAPFNQSYADM